MANEADIAAAHDRLGGKIGEKYRLLSVLGVGGMGAVYEAVHELTERRVALKLLHSYVAATPSAAQRFLQEAKAPAAIRHPAIADVLDAGREPDGSVYLAFEFLEGEDLAHAVAAGRIDPPSLLRYLIEVTGGLAAAHARGFVHRDVKPANIFLARHGAEVSAKLLDFGIARRSRTPSRVPLTEAGVVIGTPYFMSPEQMRGEDVDHRADLWSIGVVFYFGLTGELPFVAQNYNALMVEMVRGTSAVVQARKKRLPRALVAVIDKALAPQLEARYRDAGELQRALEQALAALLGRPAGARVPEKLGWEKALAEIEAETLALRAKKKLSS